jgi:hypothetical protein
MIKCQLSEDLGVVFQAEVLSLNNCAMADKWKESDTGGNQR